ncbi:leucine-rich repeat-containing protein (LRR) [Tieghemostelium lacteum]|uniref:Leucine-rich repeat-containing protein (LRR) n=1 Tax=Tieghemostelium lacteum TaxID=361077 RepID=A0A151Z7K4_TIELA|nr:leucine-rich repeat-containing protein (LRR) [Tieghemostelium lacteum]|eukprot:KYQ89946.1 leucine-rich repeat-containing protein (LRR) [Tieghemostelium lacteum]
MRLTAELILRSPESINPCSDRELNLRGKKISTIENLGATKDQYDTIDFSDNEISKLENFPQLNRLKTLLFNNNHICRIDDDFAASLPNLTNLVLSKNRISKLSDLVPLEKLQNIKYISLLENEVTKVENYRYYLIYVQPRLKYIDFSKVKKVDREESLRLFGTSKSVLARHEKKHKQNGKNNKTFTPGEELNQHVKTITKNELTGEEKKQLMEAINNAKSVEEMDALERKLKTGQKLIG